MELVPRDHGWPGLRRFAVLAAVLFACTAIAVLTVHATAVHDMRPVDIAALVWCLAVLPLVLGSAARLLGKRDRFVAVAGAGLGAGLLALFLAMGATPAQAAPRDLLGGHTRGSVADVAASQAAWAEISPARVWSERVTTSSHTSMKDGRSYTSSESVAPLVAELPWTRCTATRPALPRRRRLPPCPRRPHRRVTRPGRRPTCTSRRPPLPPSSPRPRPRLRPRSHRAAVARSAAITTPPASRWSSSSPPSSAVVAPPEPRREAVSRRPATDVDRTADDHRHDATSHARVSAGIGAQRGSGAG